MSADADSPVRISRRTQRSVSAEAPLVGLSDKGPAVTIRIVSNESHAANRIRDISIDHLYTVLHNLWQCGPLTWSLQAIRIQNEPDRRPYGRRINERRAFASDPKAGVPLWPMNLTGIGRERLF